IFSVGSAALRLGVNTRHIARATCAAGAASNKGKWSKLRKLLPQALGGEAQEFPLHGIDLGETGRDGVMAAALAGKVKRPATAARAAQQISRPRGPTMWVSSGRRGGAAPRHERVELLAVLRPLELLHEFGEGAGFVVEAAALCLEALKLAAAIFLEREVAGRGEMRTRPEALRNPGEIVPKEPLPLLPHPISHDLPHDLPTLPR